MRSFLFDLHHAFRSLRRAPGFVASSVLTLALGLGVAAVFLASAKASLLEPMAFRDAGRLVLVTPRSVKDASPWQALSAGAFTTLARTSRACEGLAAFRDSQTVLRGDGGAESFRGCLVSPGGLRALGLPFACGRDFQPGEDGVVLPYRVWQRRFGGDASVLGRSLFLDGRWVSVLGVLGKGVELPMVAGGAECFLPMLFSPGELQSRDMPSCWVLGRLAPGRTVEALRVELQGVVPLVAPAGSEREGWTLRASGLRAFYLAQSGPALAVLGILSLFLLLLTCASVAGLSLARLDWRARESALRAALGGTRGQLMGGPLAEVLILALAAAVVVVLAFRTVGNLLAGWMGLSLEPGGDPSMLVGTFGVALLVATITGLAPALMGSRVDLRELLNQGAGGSSRMRWRKGMVLFQVALATVLLAGAGLMGRALWRIRHLDVGIRTQGVLTAQFEAPVRKLTPGHPEGPYRQFFDDVAARLRAIPGVRTAGIACGMPLYGRADRQRFWTEGGDAAPFQASQQPVSSDYFQAMGIRILRGRVFQDWETGLCVVTESLARECWPGQDPLGRRLSLQGKGGPWMTVAAVAQDHRHNDIGREPVGLILTSFRQEGSSYYAVLLRTDGDPMALAPALRQAMGALSPETVLNRVEPLQAQADRNLENQRLLGRLLGTFGLLAGLLAGLGIHGVASSLARQNRRDIALRVILGAAPRRVMAQVLLRSLRQAGLGMGIGMAVALLLGLALRAILLGLDPWDLPSLLGAALGISLLAVLASLLPALRVLRMDPSQALRTE